MLNQDVTFALRNPKFPVPIWIAVDHRGGRATSGARRDDGGKASFGEVAHGRVRNTQMLALRPSGNDLANATQPAQPPSLTSSQSCANKRKSGRNGPNARPSAERMKAKHGGRTDRPAHVDAAKVVAIPQHGSGDLKTEESRCLVTDRRPQVCMLGGVRRWCVTKRQAYAALYLR